MIIDEKKFKEAERRVKQYLGEGFIQTGADVRFVQFFLRNAEDSLSSARLLYMVSTDHKKQKLLGFAEFNGLLWVVNASYYSMFYMARALLESEGVKIKAEQSIHAVTFDAIVHYFYLSGKLQKKLLNDFAEAREDAAELLGKQKADLLIEDYFFEKRKRAAFTYEAGMTVLQSKANTSLERAKRFNTEIKKLIKE